MANTFDKDTRQTMRDVLEEAVQELKPTQATQAKMAQTIMHKAAQGDMTRAELKDVAVEAGKTPAA